MVIRTFTAFDSENLIVTSSASARLIGNSIINNSATPNGTVFSYSAGGASEISLNDTRGGSSRFNDDQSSRHVITDGKGLVANGTPVESESLIRIRELDGSGNPTGPTIDLHVFSQHGAVSDIWGFATSAELQNGASYVKVSGSNNGTSRYNDYVVCFASGTRIATSDGDIAVEEIAVGQPLWTLAGGVLPVRWVGCTTVSGRDAFAPVVFEAGAIGNTQPLVVSQQHRIRIESAMADVMFGSSEVLVAAKHLIGLPGVRLDPRDAVDYVHFMFDSHQIVRANGALTESFFYAEHSVGALEAEPRAELDAMFPTLESGITQFGGTAGMTLTAREAAALRPHLAA